MKKIKYTARSPSFTNPGNPLIVKFDLTHLSKYMLLTPFTRIVLQLSIHIPYRAKLGRA
ncbi:MAG: hypothetical protein AEth_01291 [Candidatus Argoarchaeum ethanivorans]|uniref:Uncharacterized protein n=1 Tax=Candidatus Argoarchaeum ethanivorans TaxID=2608793 RepID=A0A8B3S2E2_9EURY|nr:MAG: hypothetical protein AEth_01291 [Candidatus Argoarchaeum ethanivorans]